MVVLHVGNEALNAIASAALVITALGEEGRLSSLESHRVGGFSDVSIFAADFLATLVAAELEIKSVFLKYAIPEGTLLTLPLPW